MRFYHIYTGKISKILKACKMIIVARGKDGPGDGSFFEIRKVSSVEPVIRTECRGLSGEQRNRVSATGKRIRGLEVNGGEKASG